MLILSESNDKNSQIKSCEDNTMIGLGVFDTLARDIVDPESGEIYPALSCYNDKTMADRCTVVGSPKVIWSVKASANFNSDAAILLREAFTNGRIRLLENEYDIEEALNDIRGYASLSPADKMKIQLPYINTTLLIDELTKLQHDESTGKVRVYEKAGMRKDRYSSLAYNYYVALQLENKMAKKQATNTSITNMFVIKPPKSNGKAVNKYGRT